MTSNTLTMPASMPQTVTRNPHPRVLSIAGSDPSGGAGIQADVKTISANGGYAMAAITALTAQNTQGVRDVHVPPVTFLNEQLEALSADVQIDAVKIGMLGNAQVISTVGDWLRKNRPAAIVLDPVMVATSGDLLLDPEAHAALTALFDLTDLLTPNLAELAALLHEPVAADWAAALEQGKALARAHNVRVLVKGGHLSAATCPDALVTPDGAVVEFTGPRIDTKNTHGTGCALSSAIATLYAKHGDWEAAAREAKSWLAGAMSQSHLLEVGQGAGPVNHLHALWSTAAPAADAFSRRVWANSKTQRDAIFELDFIRELAAGTLDVKHFAYYLAQDAMYLGAYSRVLARASALAPTEQEQEFWASGAQSCINVEMALHKDWLSKYPLDTEQGPVTKHYVDHLQAVAFSGSYGEVVAAVLPCYWLYAEVGRVLHADYLAFEGEHPYGNWLETYADEAFADATRIAIGYMDLAATRGSARERERMAAAYAHSSQYEVDFFAAAHLYA